MSFLLTLLVLSGCGEAAVGGVNTTEGASCDTTVSFGEIEMCLPSIEGWTESLGHPSMSSRWGAFVNPENTTFGVYISDKQLALGDAFQEVVLDDYFKLYATAGSDQYKIDTAQLTELIEEFNGSAFRSQWSDVEEYLEGKRSDIDLGRPVLVESYRLNDNVGTSLYMMRSMINGEEHYTLMTVSLVLMKKHLVFVAHYLAYNGPESVKSAKSKCDYFNLQFVGQNRS